jgi:hypothetical protein
VSNHYNEQKMLIENFRRWNEEQENEEKEAVNESVTGTLIGLLAVSTATLYTIAPYFKIAVHHPKVASVLAGDTSESNALLIALANGIKKADDAGSWLQNYTDNFLKDEQPTLQKIKNGLLLIAFFAVLSTTAFPTIGSPLVRVLPRIGVTVRNIIAKIKSRRLAKKGGPSPEQIAMMDQEIDELEELEAEKKSVTQMAAEVGEVMEMIKQDPIKYAEELGAELSSADLKTLQNKGDVKPKSKAQKVNIPAKKAPPVGDEDAD